MRILLANPACRPDADGDHERYLFGAGCRFPFSIVKNSSENPRFSMFPFFLAYTAAVLEQRGHEVHVLDGVPLNLTTDEYLDKVNSIKPELTLFEPATPSLHFFNWIAGDIKKLTGCITAFAGPHVSSVSERILHECEFADFVLSGEYEYIFADLAQCIEDGNYQPQIKGVSYRLSKEKIYQGGRSDTIKPIDSLPYPARHLFPANDHNDLSLYHDGFCQHRPMVQLHSSRGCPFRCNFCLWIQSLYDDGPHRTFSASRVVDEMEHVIQTYGAKEIYFDDDNFTAKKRHVLDICAEIKRRDVSIPWSAMSDAIVTDVEMLTAMADAGCIGIKFGLESADPEVLKRISKPLNLDKVKEIIPVATRLGIKTHACVVFGLSGDTQASIRKTFDYVCDLDIDSVQFSIATPLPGTRFYDEVKAEGRLTTENWEKYDGHNHSITRHRENDSEFIESFHAASHGRWLRHKMSEPKWFLRQVRYILRLTRGQGLRGFTLRLRRGGELLLPALFRSRLTRRT